MKRKILCFSIFFSLFFAFPDLLSAQDKKTSWFPKQCVFPLLQYDLLEVQPYAGIFYIHSNKTEKDAAYIPVNLGFRKSFLHWKWGETTYDLALGAASYTQFEVMKYDRNTLKGGLLNTDFKASGFLNILKEKHNLRIQLFHVSSHLGDDYILRNQDYELNDKSVNYEQIDLIYLHKLSKTDLYAGLGYVITPNAFRERLMIQCGMQNDFPLKPHLDFSFGLDVKIYDENGYDPDLHAGAGLTIRQNESAQLSFLLDFYTGHLPYSTLDLGKIFWIGPSCRLFL